MKHLTYVDILKMVICLNNNKEEKGENIKKATQKDIDNLLG